MTISFVRRCLSHVFVCCFFFFALVGTNPKCFVQLNLNWLLSPWHDTKTSVAGMISSRESAKQIYSQKSGTAETEIGPLQMQTPHRITFRFYLIESIRSKARSSAVNYCIPSKCNLDESFSNHSNECSLTWWNEHPKHKSMLPHSPMLR